MKRILAVLLAFLPMMLKAQGENNIWAFSEAGTRIKVLDFNSAPAHIDANFMLPVGHSVYSSAVCYPNGQLRFLVNLEEYVPWGPPYFNIIAANGIPVIGSNLRCGIANEVAQPVVIPRPGNADQYYIFYPYSNGILYCLLDMSLNGGNGAVVQKDVILAPYGTVISQKMVPVVGCDGVWLVVRSRVMNGYYSFHVTRDGVDPHAVVSAAGLLPTYDVMGFIKASPDGKLLALASYYGLELYTFEKCSGKVKSFGIVEYTNNPQPYIAHLYSSERYTDAGFSPDNSKLYTTYNRNRPEITGLAADSGKLYQYDLSLLSLPAIIGSKRLVLTNIRSIIGDLNACLADSPNPLGEIKPGPDGKLYIDNGSTTCRTPGTVPPGFNPGPGFHCLHQPNLTGLACAPELNVLDASFPNYYGGDFYKGGLGGNSYLQQEIVLAPPLPHTTPGKTYTVSVCFRDTGLIAAGEDGSCFLWDDGSEKRRRKVDHSGTYHVRYFKDCRVTTDTIKVSFLGAPEVYTRSSCPGMHTGELSVQVPAADDVGLQYIWRSGDGSILRHQVGTFADTLKPADTGDYSVEIISEYGCDTTIACHVGALPVPSIVAEPRYAKIAYGDSIRLRASGGVLYVWLPSGTLDTATNAAPVARPVRPTLYSVIGFNDDGCTDTGFVQIDIDYTMPVLIPNAFSPNGDGINDVFRVAGITYQKGTIAIYNRYGREIFRSENINQGWDGTTAGQACDAGTYFYVIELSYPDGNSRTRRGDIMLLR